MTTPTIKGKGEKKRFTVAEYKALLFTSIVMLILLALSIVVNGYASPITIGVAIPVVPLVLFTLSLKRN